MPDRSRALYPARWVGVKAVSLHPQSGQYVAAIAVHHDAVDGKSVGKHDLVIRFLRGARRLNPLRPHLVPSWDLPSVLSALKGDPFGPLQSVESESVPVIEDSAQERSRG